MKTKVHRFSVLFLFALVSLPVIASGQQKGEGGKEPYSMSVSSLQGATKTEVFITINTIDAMKYPLPTTLKQLVADPEDRNKFHLGKYTDSNVPLVNGRTSFTLEGGRSCVDFNLKVHINPPGWHDLHFDHDCNVTSRPNLRFDKVLAPQEVSENTPFDVSAIVREANGDLGATATVTLYDELTVLASLTNVVVPKGGTTNVTFQGVVIPKPGKHLLTVRISNSDPAEFDITNNFSCFTISVLGKPDLRVEKVTFPQQVFIKTSFEVVATVREATGKAGATCAVSLYDGATLLNTVSRVEVHSGSTERVTFRGIQITTAGQHSYMVKITNSNPPESDVTNNNYAFTVSALLKPDLRVESANAPTPLFANTPFDIDAVIREYNGQSGATATVTLYEGRDMQASPRQVTVAQGGSSHVVFAAIKEMTSGKHTYTIKISDVDPCESDESNNSYTFSLTVVVRPDLKVDKVTAPQSVSAGISFNVEALIKEIDGQSGTTSTVTLFEGNTSLGTIANVAVSAGGSTTVSFQGIIAATKGNHTYTVKITNANPPESDVSNNNLSFTLSAVARPDLRVDNIIAPSSTQAGTPFNVTVAVKEYLGFAGATATLTLYEGTVAIGTPQSAATSPGGSVNVVFQGVTATTPGTHTYTVKISNANPAEADITNNNQTFAVTVISKPDLRVDQVTAPQQVTPNTPFDVQVVVHELTGQSGATATVSLYEGSTLLATQLSVDVPAGGIVTVVFHGITASTSGSHTYTAVVSGTTPGETDVTNNQNTGSTSVIDLNPLEYSLVYSYDRQVSFVRQTSSSGSNSLDSTYQESGWVTYTASASTTTLPSSPITSLSWTIATPAGTFDQISLSNLTRNSWDANADYYVLSNVNNKGIDFTMRVDRAQGSMQISIHQQGAFSKRTFITPEATQITPTGDHAAVVQPNGSLSVTLAIQSGETFWGGTTSIQVSALVTVSSTSQVDTTGYDIDTGVYSTNSVYFLHTRSAGPGAPSTSAGKQNKQVAAFEDQATPSIPMAFGLRQNYPNPFNPSTTIEFSLPEAEVVSLNVYDMLGREVASLASKEFVAGTHRLRWNAAGLASGTYIYRLKAGEHVAQKKLMLLK